MGHTFRINKQGNNGNGAPITDWSTTTANTYNVGYVNKIQGTTTKQREITSIPSPFARIELIKEAFAVVSPDINSATPDAVADALNETSIYHKMVSDTLDVAQIFFNYNSLKDKVKIIAWDPKNDLQKLIDSHNASHQIAGQSLDMFFKQDAQGSDPYNFGKMQNIYVLQYIGPGCKPMHIIGATSPATLFFSTANDENSISQQLCFGTDYAFDVQYCPLNQRDPEFIKYLWALRYSNPNFDSLYPEVSKYMDAVFFTLGQDKKNELQQIQNGCQNGTFDINKTYDILSVAIGANEFTNAEINGFPLHYHTIKVQGQSDFEIKPQKQVNGTLPLVLPTTITSAYRAMHYVNAEFGKNVTVPCFDSRHLDQRTLPSIGIQYPYLTVSDLLEDKIVKLPGKLNSKDYFDAGYTNDKDSYLLPLTDTFFEYFTSDYLLGNAPSGKRAIELKAISGGIQCTLRVPVANGEIEYNRIYNSDVNADASQDRGAIVEIDGDDDETAIGIFPPVKFANPQEAHYRIVMMGNHGLSKLYACQCYTNNAGKFQPDFIVRNPEDTNDLSSKVYLVENQSFDFVRFHLTTNNSKENTGSGIAIPLFEKSSQTSSLSFAIDFGTSNTHIEYAAGNNQGKPFSFSPDNTLFSLLFATDEARPNEHINSEFIPCSIGLNDSLCRFPMRTVLNADRKNNGRNNNNVNLYEAFGNASPAFMYQQIADKKYSNYLTNLKWGNSDQNNEQNVQCYIESLFLMIRAKVLQEGASLKDTKIVWFYPSSMSPFRRAQFERLWNAAYDKYFGGQDAPVAISESVAPYRHFQDSNSGVTDITTIDIGGGTTDIVIADNDGVKCTSSMRFAADAIFGQLLTGISNGVLNGILKQCRDNYSEKLKDVQTLKDIFDEITSGYQGNSTEVASFLFSLANNPMVKEKRLENSLDFNKHLQDNDSQRIVFLIFYSAIIYYVAHLTKASKLSAPKSIAFSGNGSKVISILSSSKRSLEKLTSAIVSEVYDADTKVSLYYDSKNPKEATCKGGLRLINSNADIEVESQTVLLNLKQEVLKTNETYADVDNYISKIDADVKHFFNTIFNLKGISLSNDLGISDFYVKKAEECVSSADIKSFVLNGIKRKKTSGEITEKDELEETLFFYPIIGIMNNISDIVGNSNDYFNE